VENTSRLDLPYIMPSQAQKHVTYNDALRMLDCLVQPVVKSRTLSAPPASPAAGDGYIVAAGSADAWAGKENSVACFVDGAWQFFTPAAGWQFYDAGAGERIVFTGTGWISADAGGSTRAFFGIHTDADATNRLAVAAAASLFTHEGSDHRIKVNKASTADTASHLFQTGYSGRAEFGLTGDDDFSIKMSSDGGSWTTVLKAGTTEMNFLNGVTGYVNIGPHSMSTAPTSGGAAMEISANIPGDRYAFFDFHASDAQSDYSSRFIRNPGTNGSFMIENVGAGGIFLDGADGPVSLGNGNVQRSQQSATDFSPATDNAYSLGNATHRWTSLWAANGTIQTSDARDKAVVGELPFAGRMVDAIEPKLFRWKVGGKAVNVTGRRSIPMNPGNPGAKSITTVETEESERPGRRVHAGFLAQDLKAAMEKAGVDFGAWGLARKDDPDSRQWTRPDQLVAVLWSALKQTRADLEELKAALAALKA
jgi:hypothetical protein